MVKKHFCTETENHEIKCTEGRTTCNQSNIIRSTESASKTISNKIMSSTYNDDDDDDIKKVVALRGDFTNCECVDWAWMRACMCVCVLLWGCFFFHWIPTSPFIHLTQSSSGVLHGNIGTCIQTHTCNTDVHPIRNIFIYAAAASMTIIACFCCIIIARVFCMKIKRKFSVHDSCLWIWYPHRFWLLAANDNIVCKERQKERERESAYHIDIYIKPTLICPTFLFFTWVKCAELFLFASVFYLL